MQVNFYATLRQIVGTKTVDFQWEEEDRLPEYYWNASLKDFHYCGSSFWMKREVFMDTSTSW